jgi:hypothetical protein
MKKKWLYRFSIWRNDKYVFKVESETEHGAYMAFKVQLEKHSIDLLNDKTITFVATYSRDDDAEIKYLRFVAKDIEEDKWMKHNGD